MSGLGAPPREPGPPASGRPALHPRTRPTQQRARETVDHLLEASAGLLSELGVDAFTTNLLAERAGVGIRTVYRYFPNKLAILVALTERISGEWGWLDGGFDRLADPSWDWRAAWEDLSESFIHASAQHPGWVAIMPALRALPEVREVAREQADLAADRLAGVLRRRGARGSDEELRRCAHVVLEVGGQLTDLVLARDGKMPEDMGRELRRMQCAHLSRWLDPDEGFAVGRVDVARIGVCHEVRRRVFVQDQGVSEALEFDGKDAECRHFVARRAGEGEAIGAARLRTSDGRPKAERVAVLPEYRGRGVGRALMRAIEGAARAQDFGDVILHAQESAIGFYEALGYRCEGEPFEEEGIPHRFMRKPFRAQSPGRS